MTQGYLFRGLEAHRNRMDAEALEDNEDDDEEDQLTCLGKIEAFFNAPKITFLINTVSFY